MKMIKRFINRYKFSVNVNLFISVDSVVNKQLANLLNPLTVYFVAHLRSFKVWLT